MASKKTKSILIYGASQIVRVVSNGRRYLRGTDHDALKDLAILSKKTPTDNLCLVSIGYVQFLNCFCSLIIKALRISLFFF